jgi:hypothetical protein
MERGQAFVIMQIGNPGLDLVYPEKARADLSPSTARGAGCAPLVGGLWRHCGMDSGAAPVSGSAQEQNEGKKLTKPAALSDCAGFAAHPSPDCFES